MYDLIIEFYYYIKILKNITLSLYLEMEMTFFMFFSKNR